MQKIVITLLVLSIFASTAWSRPVSYPGGITSIVSNNGDAHSALIHYSPSRHYAIGLRSEYRRAPEYVLTSVQLNNLLKRWNNKSSQANVYLKSGIGVADRNSSQFSDHTEAAFFTGLAFDWETRQHFFSYENRFVEAGDLGDFYVQRSRIGFAPYIADYGALHTWLMLEVEHEPEDEDTFTVTPIIRFFKDVHLVELGLSNHNDALFNWTVRF